MDEETYQKLLSDDVDVVYNTINMTTKDIDSDKNITMTFSYAICTADIMQIVSIDIQISSTSPHLVVKGDPAEQVISPEQVVNKSTLSPVLQEIDLTGTDADRKAKLDQFETDWKALTGADDLTGARFVGTVSSSFQGETETIWFTYAPYVYENEEEPAYIGLCHMHNETNMGLPVQNIMWCVLSPETGKLEYNNLLREMAERYRLTYTEYDTDGTSDIYMGVTFEGENENEIGSLTFGNVRLGKVAAPKTGDEVTNKAYVDAIKNNASKSLEAITIKTGNTPDDKAANVAAIKAYVDNLIALGVDTTKGYMIPAKLDSGSLDGFVSYHSDIADYPWSGIFIRPSGSGKFVAMKKDGFVVLINDILISGNIYNTLTTTSKGIIPAINEVNALVEKKADKSLNAKSFEAITIGDNTTEGKAATKAAIEAYRDNLMALGVDVTKGFMIPIKSNNGNGFILFDGTTGEGYIKRNGDRYGILINT